MTKQLSLSTCDFAIIDLVTHADDFPFFESLWKQFEMKPGAKSGLDNPNAQIFDDVFVRAQECLGSDAIKHFPGGSSANLVTTLQRLMQHSLSCHFLGVIGDDKYGKEIASEFADAGVNLMPVDNNGIVPETTISYVINPATGNRALATYPGNAAKILQPGVFREEMVRDHDILLVQGSMWQKFGADFANQFTRARFDNPQYHNGEGGKNQEMWLALPTHAKFGKENADFFQLIIPSSNIVVGNDEELDHICSSFDTNADDYIPPINRIQKSFQLNVLGNCAKPERRRQVALITFGENGAVVITADSIMPIPSFKIDKKDIKSTLGAGDTAAGFFLAAHLKTDEKGQPLFTEEECGIISMAGAIGNLRVPGARILQPREMLIEVLSDKAAYPDSLAYDQAFFDKVENAFFPERAKEKTSPSGGQNGHAVHADLPIAEGGTYGDIVRRTQERPRAIG